MTDAIVRAVTIEVAEAGEGLQDQFSFVDHAKLVNYTHFTADTGARHCCLADLDIADLDLSQCLHMGPRPSML